MRFREEKGSGRELLLQQTARGITKEKEVGSSEGGDKEGRIFPSLQPICSQQSTPLCAGSCFALYEPPSLNLLSLIPGWVSHQVIQCSSEIDMKERNYKGRRKSGKTKSVSTLGESKSQIRVLLIAW